MGASLCDAEVAGPCQGREGNHEAWQANPLGRIRQSWWNDAKMQSGKSAERTAKVACLRTKTHRIESRAMWEIPVASIRISYSSFAGAKPRSRLCIKGPGPEVRPPSFLHGKRPVNHEKNCYVNRTMNKLPGQRVWATRWLCTASRRKLGQESGGSR